MIFKKIPFIFLLSIFLLSDFRGYTQSKTPKKIDSLDNLCQNESDLIKKAELIDNLLIELYTNYDSVQFQFYKNKYYALAMQLKSDALLTSIYHQTGIYYYYQGDINKGILYLDSAIYLSKKNKSEKKLMTHLMTRGALWYMNQNYYAALNDYFTTEKLMLKYNSEKIGGLYSNIAMLYTEIDDLNQSELYSRKAIPLIKLLNDNEGLAKILNNLGLIQKRKNNFGRADSLLRVALEVAKKGNYKRDISDIEYNLASVLLKQEKYEEALPFYLDLREIVTVNKENDWKKVIEIDIAYIYVKLNNKTFAKKYLESAENLKWGETQIIKREVDYYNQLASVYFELGDFKKAAQFFSKALNLQLKVEKETSVLDIQKVRYANQKEKDSLEFAKQKQIDDLYNAKIQEEAEHKLNRQRIIITISVLIVVLFSIFSGFLYRAIKQKETANKELVSQKKLVSIKNLEITDSIQYAKRIQNSLLPTKQLINQLLPSSFLINFPKDIVSGDFYWIKKINTEEFYVAVADCTGHGVPGAIMSALSIQQLNEISGTVKNPGEILQQLNIKLKANLQQDEEGYSKDGLDICFCKVNLKERKIVYCGANRNLWIFNNNGFKAEIKATKAGIAGHTSNEQKFEENEVLCDINDFFVLSSDGYADQFGGPNQKKITTKQFKLFISEARAHNLPEIGNHLKEKYLNWKNNSEQIDDVCVLGFKLA